MDHLSAYYPPAANGHFPAVARSRRRQQAVSLFQIMQAPAFTGLADWSRSVIRRDASSTVALRCTIAKNYVKVWLVAPRQRPRMSCTSGTPSPSSAHSCDLRIGVESRLEQHIVDASRGAIESLAKYCCTRRAEQPTTSRCFVCAARRPTSSRQPEHSRRSKAQEVPGENLARAPAACPCRAWARGGSP